MHWSVKVAAFAWGVTGTISPTDQNVQRRQNPWTIGQTVQTSSGPVQGHDAEDATTVSEYLGIPYARPPIGGLRFQPPSLYNGTNTINGTSFGYMCLQAGTFLDGKYQRRRRDARLDTTAAGKVVLEEFDGTIPQDEDCLTLNVWTKPQTGEVKKAVMVWILGRYPTFNLKAHT